MTDRLPELNRFNAAKGITPGEPFDALLAASTHPICLFTSAEDRLAADHYRAVIGKEPSDFEISLVKDPIKAAIGLQTSGVIPLVMYSATNPVLFERMFADGPRLGQLLMGYIYEPNPGYQSPSVHVVGITNQGLDIIGKSPVDVDKPLAEQMVSRRREILGEDFVSPEEFKAILKSSSVSRVIAHALGPKGTNISQAMELFIRTLGMEGKTNLIVHPAGIEPLAYAETASKQVEEGVVPIHMECAVFYDMHRLFRERAKNEIVLAAHQYMALDAMQLASVLPIEEFAAEKVMRIATHPSPRPLINPWVEAGRAEWIKASSNSAAALMVLNEQVDACITTASGLKQTPGLVSRHIFGSPYMFFTIATPLSQAQLKSYR